MPTVTLPMSFKSPERELMERSRALAHVHQWHFADGPNHGEARAAAAMPPARRADSAEFAACELTAQTAALQAVTRAGGTYHLQPKAFNHALRPHWAEQVETPGGLEKFGRSADQASRVCDGRQPTRELEREHRRAVYGGGPVATRGAGRPVGGAPPLAAPAQSSTPQGAGAGVRVLLGRPVAGRRSAVRSGVPSPC